MFQYHNFVILLYATLNVYTRSDCWMYSLVVLVEQLYSLSSVNSFLQYALDDKERLWWKTSSKVYFIHVLFFPINKYELCSNHLYMGYCTWYPSLPVWLYGSCFCLLLCVMSSKNIWLDSMHSLWKVLSHCWSAHMQTHTCCGVPLCHLWTSARLHAMVYLCSFVPPF